MKLVESYQMDDMTSNLFQGYILQVLKFTAKTSSCVSYINYCIVVRRPTSIIILKQLLNWYVGLIKPQF